MARRNFPLSRVYGLLEPGPVVLLSTCRDGRNNVMTMSWQTMLDFEPPLLACVVSDGNASFGALRRTRECVINIPTSELAEKVVACGNCSGAKIDKFTAFGLTAKPARLVGAPLIAECFANLECRVVDTRMVAKYSLFVLEVVHAWRETSIAEPRTLHHMGRGRFMVAGEQIRLRSKMK